jgi:hypothetical protein
VIKNSKEAYAHIQNMIIFLYRECQKRSEHPMTPHILEVIGNVRDLTQQDEFRGDAMKMAMLLISFGRLYQFMEGPESIVLKAAEEEVLQ